MVTILDYRYARKEMVARNTQPYLCVNAVILSISKVLFKSLGMSNSFGTEKIPNRSTAEFTLQKSE
jgi:hypothetical protein